MLPPPLENNPFLCSSEGQYGPTYAGTVAAYAGCDTTESRIGPAARHRISGGSAVGEDTGHKHILPVLRDAVGAGVAIPPVHVCCKKPSLEGAPRFCLHCYP